MSEQSFIKMDYFINGNAPAGHQAKFLAQQHFNNNGMGDCVVVSAEFTDGGINVVYSAPPIDTEDEIDLKPDEKDAFDDAVIETVGESDGEIVFDSGEVIESIGPEQPEPKKRKPGRPKKSKKDANK